MQDIYFACDWVLRKLDSPDALALVTSATDLGGAIFVGALSTNENGLFLRKIVAQFPSKDIFDKFTVGPATKLKMSAWYPISIEDDLGTFFNMAWVQGLVDFVESAKMFGAKNSDLNNQSG